MVTSVDTPHPTPVLTVGRASLRTDDAGRVEVRSERAPGLVVVVPAARLEAWCLRLLREELAA